VVIKRPQNGISTMAKPHLLLINPNTSDDITETIRRLAVAEIGSHAAITAVTATFGARYISSRAAVAIAAHGVLDAFASALASGLRPDAVIVACFGDPGLDALKEMTSTPVFGFADGGLIAAAAEPGTFAIATIGDAWRDMLAELALRRGLAHRLAGIIVLDASTRAPEVSGPLIEKAARNLGASRVVVGGTGLIPMLDELAQRINLPVIDAHRVTLHDAARITGAARVAATPPMAGPPVVGLSPALTRLLQNGAAN
jgi:Asp/Glu/hydantoin racemase